MKKDNSEKINISIGIPAYNEGANIQKLLKSILKQKQDEFNFSEIIVVSDGSTDNTQKKVLELMNKKIILINHRLRQGKSAILSEIIKQFKGDILFLLDADILITDKNLFENLLKQAEFKKSGVIAINAIPKDAKNYFQRFINAGCKAMKDISLSWNNGENYLSFKGCFLGMEKDFVKKLTINPRLINNDIYFYLMAKKFGYSPAYIDNVKVYYKSPMNLTDHINQNERFRNSKSEMKKYFNYDISSEYKIPKYLVIKAILKNLILSPFYFSGYLIIKLYSELKKRNEASHIWHIAVSTKQ